MQKLMKMPGVITVELDQCAYGLSATDEDGTAPVKRPARIVTTLTAAELLLTRKCTNTNKGNNGKNKQCERHRHATNQHDKAEKTEKFTEELCDSMLDCLILTNELLTEYIQQSSVNSIFEMHEEFQTSQDDIWDWTKDYKGHRDANTGETLDAEQVREGRRKELQRVQEQNTYEVVTREQAFEYHDPTFIGTKWVELMKPTGEVRCRFVGQEFADQQRDDLFASTPALWIARLLATFVAKHNGPETPTSDTELYTMLALDVSGAFLYAKTSRNLFIELPKEDKRSQNKNLVGRLLKALYGTRDAPQAWQKELTETLISLGFTQCHDYTHQYSTITRETYGL